MAKRKVTISLLMCLILLCCAACGKKQQEVPKTAPAETVVETTTEETVPAAEEIVEEPTAEEPEEETGTEYDVIPESFAYSLTVSINPLAELYFDGDDIVVGIAYLNEDAVDAYKDLNLLGTTLGESVDLLVSAATDKGYLKDDGKVEIELAKVGEEGGDVSASVLTTANQAASKCLQEQETETPVSAVVEIKVSEDVQETTGLKTPEICPDCNGTGNSCKECGGTGDVRCKRCNNGIESCGTCHGTAIITCHGCHGSGTQGDQGETCHYCGGSGRQSCDACHGQGTFSCSWCHGALHHICPECWNEGTCNTCGGTGIK